MRIYALALLSAESLLPLGIDSISNGLSERGYGKLLQGKKPAPEREALPALEHDAEILDNETAPGIVGSIEPAGDFDDALDLIRDDKSPRWDHADEDDNNKTTDVECT